MDTFWKWMEEKGYARYDDDFESWLVRVKVPFSSSRFVFWRKQMLIGYMQEFLYEHNETGYSVCNTEQNFNLLESIIEKVVLDNDTKNKSCDRHCMIPKRYFK